MIMLIDNYDSFSYNLYQLIGSVYPDIEVVRNDAVDIEDIESTEPVALILSPGPGRPAEAGICEEAVRRFNGKIPILGVCLGHQAIVEAFGGVVDHAAHLMHGKTSEVTLDGRSRLFEGIGSPLTVGRYHSLSAVREDLPECLKVTSTANDGEVMAVEHLDCPTFGLQFHPESIMTASGKAIIENFVSLLPPNIEKEN